MVWRSRFIKIGLGMVVGFVGARELVRRSTLRRLPKQGVPFHSDPNAPVLKPGQTLKVFCLNAQFMAGKDYVFFFDVEAADGPDQRPSAESVNQTLEQLAQIIIDEDPDVILLQEVDDGAARTDYQDQLQRLLDLLPNDYANHASAFYWRASYVPHPRIRGRVGMKLSTISKYKIEEATRYNLALVPISWLERQFSPKRAILSLKLPLTNGKHMLVMNTHLEAFAQGHRTMEDQVAQVRDLLDSFSAEYTPWLIGGDYNLLPDGQYETLAEHQKYLYAPKTELNVLHYRYKSVPSRVNMRGKKSADWFTHNTNDPLVDGADRTIDYIFHSHNLRVEKSYVRQHDTLALSDHFPLIAHFKLPRRR